MRITLLCKRYYTNKDLIKDKFGRLYHLPVQLAKLGHDIVVIAIDYRNTKVTECTLDDVNFITLPATVSQLPFLPYRAYQAIRKAQPDILICSGDSHIGYLGWQISRRLKCRFAFDVYDYYPAFKGNQIPGMKTMFRIAVQKAELVLCASQPLQKRLEQWNNNTLLAENGVDKSLFRPMDKKVARRRLGIDTHIPVIGFFGSITPCKGPLLIDACQLLRKKHPTLLLLLSGTVSEVDIGQPWIRYLGNVDQTKVPNLIGACDVVSLPLDSHPQNDVSGACKIAEYLACKRPVVATRISSHKDFFSSTPESLCEPDVEDMARAIDVQLTIQLIEPFPEELNWAIIAQKINNALNT
ncbi:MAG: glycosyltransferase [Methylococcales bacterium]|nr:glycosyltransferase [Methylococcales bacterium]